MLGIGAAELVLVLIIVAYYFDAPIVWVAALLWIGLKLQPKWRRPTKA
jgi:hypothetical protein